MSPWLKLAALGLAILAALYAFHRLALRLERAGYMCYLKNGTGRGAASCLFFQEELEPSVKHVVAVRDDAHSRQLEQANWNKWLADLMAAAARDPIDRETLRQIVAGAARDGLDWRRLYAAARNMESKIRPPATSRLPAPDDVAPREEV